MFLFQVLTFVQGVGWLVGSGVLTNAGGSTQVANFKSTTRALPCPPKMQSPALDPRLLKTGLDGWLAAGLFTKVKTSE